MLLTLAKYAEDLSGEENEKLLSNVQETFADPAKLNNGEETEIARHVMKAHEAEEEEEEEEEEGPSHTSSSHPIPTLTTASPSPRPLTSRPLYPLTSSQTTKGDPKMIAPILLHSTSHDTSGPEAQCA